MRTDKLYLADIVEAAARVSEQLAASHPEIPWRDMAGFRNIAIHAYFAVDWKIVWRTATEDVPMLQTQIQSILDPAF